MDMDVVRLIQSHGYEVYMLDAKRTWLFFTDGDNIGYLQYDKMRGYSLSTVHRPDNCVGTGYIIAEMLNEADLTKEILMSAFTHAPSWARDANRVVKYSNMKDFLKYDKYNSKYTKI